MGIMTSLDLCVQFLFKEFFLGRRGSFDCASFFRHPPPMTFFPLLVSEVKVPRPVQRKVLLLGRFPFEALSPVLDFVVDPRVAFKLTWLFQPKSLRSSVFLHSSPQIFFLTLSRPVPEVNLRYRMSTGSLFLPWKYVSHHLRTFSFKGESALWTFSSLGDVDSKALLTFSGICRFSRSPTDPATRTGGSALSPSFSPHLDKVSTFPYSFCIFFS